MIVLIAFGFAAIYSVALAQSVGEFVPVKKQAIALLIGAGFFFILLLTNYRVLKSFSPHTYILGVVLLILVLLFGDTIRGTTGWLGLERSVFSRLSLLSSHLC